MKNIIISKEFTYNKIKSLNLKFLVFIITTIFLVLTTTQAYSTQVKVKTNDISSKIQSSISNSNSKILSKQQILFLKVEKDLAQGKISSFIKHENELKHYILYPYLIYQDYINRLKYISIYEVESFIKDYKDSVLAKRLKTKWLLEQAGKKNWEEYLKLYTPVEEPTLKCHYFNAKLQKNRIDEKIYEEISKMWLSSKSLPNACNQVFKKWEKTGHKTKGMIWERIKLTMKNNNYKLTKYLAENLNQYERDIVNLWIKTLQYPKLIYNFDQYKKQNPIYSDIITSTIIKIANSNPKEALKLWKIYDQKIIFKKSQWNLVIKSIGGSLINKGYNKAAKWLEKLPDKYASEDLFNIKLKYALLQKDWDFLIKILTKLPKDIADTDKWQYWKARALYEKGHHNLCKQILTNLSTKRNYYGLIASLRLLKPFTIKNKNYHLTKDEINNVLSLPCIARAIELYKLKKQYLANCEWFFAIKNFPEDKKQAAAYIANKLNISNWSIVALSQANNQDDLNLRFPLNYSKHIIEEAKRNSIDPAWIFAITRQESAFIPNARSRAGALGLMQLIPSTGKMVAKTENLKLTSSCELFKVDNNIKLGSKYFKMMLKRYNNNYVLAIAAYNAGPRKIEEWLPKDNMEADIWIETIPFRETRNYVQNVLTYTVIYQLLLNNTQKIQFSLNHVPSRYACINN